MQDKMEECVLYPCTNESIQAVIAGLDLKKDDVVISIAGSGDIPFAIAPHVKKVYAVDKNRAQVNYVREQMLALGNGDFESFYCEELKEFFRSESFVGGRYIRPENLKQRREYFSGDNLIKVVDSLPKIQVLHKNIEDILSFFSTPFDKVYLSNVFPLRSHELKNLSKDGLVYCSNFLDDEYESKIFPTLDFDLNRSNTASRIEGRTNPYWEWVPGVYRKIA